MYDFIFILKFTNYILLEFNNEVKNIVHINNF
jgi:hypothetical protein